MHSALERRVVDGGGNCFLRAGAPRPPARCHTRSPETTRNMEAEAEAMEAEAEASYVAGFPRPAPRAPRRRTRTQGLRLAVGTTPVGCGTEAEASYLTRMA